VHSSYVQSGMLVEASHLPAYHVTRQPGSNTSIITRVTPLLTGLRQSCTDTTDEHSNVDSIPLVVFGASLAGGWDEDNDIADTVELDSDVDVDKFLIERLLATAQSVVDCGALVLACQKVSSSFVCSSLSLSSEAVLFFAMRHGMSVFLIKISYYLE